MAKSLPAGPRNPFEFGRELSAEELVDRESELEAISRVITNRGKLFFIGPRRFGKTSILNAIEGRLTKSGAVVLRYDAEAYETLGRLAQALLTGAARHLAGPLDRAGETTRKFFAKLRPNVTYDLADHRLSVSLGVASEGRKTELPLLTDVLDGIEHLAAREQRPVAVVLDEFQQVIREGGEDAERQLRAAIQRHRHVSYIFAGSKTRLLADLTSDPGRAFWKLGQRLFLGPIPRDEFRAFLVRGFSFAGFSATPEGVERILDAAEDVPYNVQRLASACWEALRVSPDHKLTPEAVDAALHGVVQGENPAYMQLWQSLTQVQKKALKAVIEEQGREVLARAVLHRHGLAASSMQRALRSLDALGVIREDETAEAIRYRLEDPFFAAWLAVAQRD
jgi:AAA+ ATPase superfamily predicted ATPase